MAFFQNTKIHWHIIEDIISMTHSDSVPLTLYGVDTFHVFKITVKDQNQF